MAADTAAAQGSLLQELYGQGVHAFFLREHEKAYELFSMAIERGTRDPRVYYFRGFVSSRMGRPEETRKDFEKGAEFEAAGEGIQIDIGAALQRVQGPVRLQLENLRYQARLQAQLLQARQREERYEALRRDEERVLRDPTLREDTELPTPPDDADDPFAADDRPAVEPAVVDDETETRTAPEARVTDDPFADPVEPVELPSEEDVPAEPAQPQHDEVDPFDAPPADEDDLFGLPADPADEDDMFELPVDPADEDDLFDAPPVDPADEDDLFDAPPVDPADEDDPFDAPPVDRADEDDMFELPVDPADEGDLFGLPGDADDPFGDEPDPVPPAAPGGTLFDGPDSDPFADPPIGGSSAAVGGVDASSAGAPPPEDGLLPGDMVPAHGEPPAPAIDPALPPGGLPPAPEEPADADQDPPGEPFDTPFDDLDPVDAADDLLDQPLPDDAGFEQDAWDADLLDGQEERDGDPFADPEFEPQLSDDDNDLFGDDDNDLFGDDDNDLFGDDEDPFANPPPSELGDALPVEHADPFADEEGGGQVPWDDF